MTELSAEALLWKKMFGLEPHPEGGYYAEVYASGGFISTAALPGHGGDRRFLTSIYFMLVPDEVSRFHRLRSDEIWYYHAGGSITIHCIDREGGYRRLQLGSRPERGEGFQAVVPAGTWFGATLESDAPCLVGCAVAPGFDFADFELADRKELLLQFPECVEIIEALTMK